MAFACARSDSDARSSHSDGQCSDPYKRGLGPALEGFGFMKELVGCEWKVKVLESLVIMGPHSVSQVLQARRADDSREALAEDAAPARHDLQEV